ncbi:hypothetical protein EUX98_g3934 [Antrodiella citrinella]|uniref:Uncharacterized protein n=1 Tax=Antrodiella citrinella TaxID=2447956 RepID=A0A4S4MY60_9APHY|nr:hypothetical protein EUX98_g3934 [Antrodiella citrinella]
MFVLGMTYIHKDIFDEFVYTPEDGDARDEDADAEPRHTVFEVSMPTLLECLSVFGSAGGKSAPGDKAKNKNKQQYRGWRKASNQSDNDSDGDHGGRSGRSGNSSGRIEQYLGGNEKGIGMRMAYGGVGYPLTLLMAEDADGPTATCEVTTYEADPVLDLPFDSDATVLKIILKSSWLHDALSELHSSSCEKLTIVANPPPPPGRAANHNAPPRLRLMATGPFGTTEMDYPSDKEVLESCECDTHISFTYKMLFIAEAIRALQSSMKTSLRIDEGGLLSLQLMMPSVGPRGKTPDAFIEFRCLSIDEST